MKKLIAVTILAGLTVTGLQAGEEGKGRGGDPAERAAKLIESADTDADGSLSQEEFAASKAGERITEKEGAEKVEEVFAKLDTDSSESLTEAELAEMKGKGKGGKKGKGKGKGGKGGGGEAE